MMRKKSEVRMMEGRVLEKYKTIRMDESSTEAKLIISTQDKELIREERQQTSKK
jgi:hypothetical protein